MDFIWHQVYMHVRERKEVFVEVVLEKIWLNSTTLLFPAQACFFKASPTFVSP